jgi:hypothetical protein
LYRYNEGTSYFRAGGGASLPLTAHAAVLRHRAALHVQLVSACLAAGLADQAGMCIRWGCTSSIQFTHSLKAPGFNPWNYTVCVCVR